MLKTHKLMPETHLWGFAVASDRWPRGVVTVLWQGIKTPVFSAA
ncbi:MAG: hypothetical protein ACYTFK_08695 [Planctomycetota bacterium]